MKIIFFDDINRINDNDLKNFNLGIINNKDKSMKVVILAGGFGTRIAEAAVRNQWWRLAENLSCTI